jgi:cobalt-precorrin 5A hydrolase
MASYDADYTVDGDQAMIAKIQREQLSIGFGCSSRACSDDILRLIEASLEPIPRGTVLATLDRCSSLGKIVAIKLDLRLVLLPADELAGVTGTTTYSALALAKTSTANVAEASALAALGPSARLLQSQTKGRFCTCAVAVLHVEVQS